MSEVRLIDANALKLMKVAECAGHTIEYAAGWKRCVEYCKNDAPTVDAVPWEFLERYADWFCASVSFPKFIREAKAFYRSSVAAMDGFTIADGERRSE